MRIFVLKSFLLLFFSGLGLISCAPDKRTETQDSFRLDAPMILTEKGATTAFASQAISTVFSTEDRISFPSLKATDFSADPIRISARSSCKGPFQATAEPMSFANVSEIALRDLLPVETLIYSPGQKGPFHCLIRFEVRNKHGSIHKFSTPNLSVQAPERALGIELRGTDPSLSPKLAARTFDEPTTHLLKLERPTVNSGTETIHLICGGFKTKIAATRLDLEGFRSLSHASPVAYEGASLRDPAMDPEQVCRVVSESVTESRSVKASAAFTLRFPPARLKIWATTEMNGYANDSAQLRIPAFSARILNPHSVPIPAAFPKGRSNTIHLAPAFGTSHDAVSGPMKNGELEWEITGAEILADPGVVKFIVPPGGTVNVRAFIRVHYSCNYWNSKSIIRFGEGFLGFYFHLDREALLLLQTSNHRLGPNGGFEVGYRQRFLELPESRFPGRPLPFWSGWTRSSRAGHAIEFPASEPANLSPHDAARVSCSP